MKLREFQRLISRYIEPSLSEMRLLRDRLVRSDGDPIVRGFAFGRSQMNKDIVSLHVFAQPVFVPADVIHLGISKPLGDFLFHDEADESALMEEMLRSAEREGQAFLERVSDCSSLADTVLEIPGDRMDERLGGGIRAYCLLRYRGARAAGGMASQTKEALQLVG